VQKLQQNFYLVILFCIFIAYFRFDFVLNLLPQLPLILGLVIFTMGLTLEFKDFKLCLSQPKAVFLGLALQFLLMPALAFAIAKLLGLDSQLAIGLVLVGSCPGGTVSNVFSYIAKADLALSVVMTFSSTLFAPLMLPLSMWLYASEWIQVDTWSLFRSSLEIVLVPLVLGMLAKILIEKSEIKLTDFESSITALAVILVSTVILVIVSVNYPHISKLENLSTMLIKISSAVILLHGLGLALGYWLSRKLGERQSKTISIEVGMQNSGLASVLAQIYFAPVTVVPAIISGALQCFCGSLLMNYWNRTKA